MTAELFAHNDTIVRQCGVTQVEGGRLLGLSRLGVPVTAPCSDVNIVIRQPRSSGGRGLHVANSVTA